MSLPELTDAELAESRKLLLRFARIQLPDRPDLAEDLVQETMLPPTVLPKVSKEMHKWVVGCLPF